MHLRKFFILAIVSSAFVTAAPPVSAADNTAGNTVVMVSIDGLAAYYFDDPKADMPNIHELAAAGARATSMKVVAPSVTWPNHTTLVTGAPPSIHGVVGNNYFDRKKREQVTLIYDPVLDKDQIVKVPTIYDIAKSNGMTTVGVNWPATRNAKTLDWTTPEVHQLDLYKKYTTPAVIDDCRENGFSLVDEMFDGTTRKPESQTDETDTRTLIALLAKHHPRLALIHLANVDHVEHNHGPKSPEAYAAIKQADDEVGQIWKELQRDFAGNATLFVVSDHGFTHIKTMIFPNIVLQQAGLVHIKGKKVTGGSVRFVSQSGAGMVYVLDTKNRKAVMAKVEKAFRGLKGISKIIHTDHLKDYGVATPKQDPNAPDMMLFAEEGYRFGDTANGDLPFSEKPERLGSHGHDPSLPHLHATFVACGNGIKSGVVLGEIPNIDVAPTMAKLLKISLPNATGQPLDKILKTK